ncbi:hypothetical protein PYW08_002170 [Mythimna loreyi]|uniref:Uncharacterized protein n=1 Tax=Mythimna loreyi TaxID=667449 RepID=A0ACC2R3Q8_9NEOP|nr:hypothetical protein PYW08_002170 [Mythimna loreyi]
MRFIIFLAILGFTYALPKSIHRIVGGSPTTIETYPYMSNMQYKFNVWWFQSCGGSLLTPTSVLSAAHCFYGDEAWEWRVILGSSLISSGGSVHAVSQLILHHEYVPATLNNDVAIVRLNNAAVYSNRVQPATIAGANYHLADDTTVTHVGWGTLWSNGPSSEQLMHVDIKIINQQLCAERYAYLKTQPGYQNWPDITNAMLCSGILDVGGKDACQGDSGGPLVYSGKIIVGVTSWGYECADSFYPGVNTRVSQFSSWIVANAS